MGGLDVDVAPSTLLLEQVGLMRRARFDAQRRREALRVAQQLEGYVHALTGSQSSVKRHLEEIQEASRAAERIRSAVEAGRLARAVHLARHSKRLVRPAPALEAVT